ncbi:Olfactory receptor 2AK2 [Camelus dromedarius]|uniref:Olfactory receptor 2AK2 n=1 Tax=Camelus dromedarius TaxID=9838 RepID=A0A5N4ED48_CAMDR|nr:Olfactory receptor 2AK2 [Camelus dromedarius]
MDSFLFVAIAILFSVALMGNITLILLIRLDPRLHTPMYFLLSQLSFIDMMYISTTVPKMAVNFLSNSKTITFLGCEIQTFVFLVLGRTEALLLGFMSYDRYVAICHPLRYPDISEYEYTVILSGLIILLLPFMAILTSYACVLTVVFQMSSGKGQTKAISTCSSHLLVASLFYMTTLSTYTTPHSMHSPEQDKVVAVFYTIITPLLNPFIYSLRNKEVIGALRRLIGLCIFVQKI